jgi:hypothetical protein
MENKIEIKKLVGNGNMAKLSHVIEGNMYYNVQTEDGLYQFPICGFVKESAPLFKMVTDKNASDGLVVNYKSVDNKLKIIYDELLLINPMFIYGGILILIIIIIIIIYKYKYKK